jgi:hypothetical protein
MKKIKLSFAIILLGLSLYAQKNIFEENFKSNNNKWALLSNIKKDSATLTIAKNQLIIDGKQQGATVALIDMPNKKIDILKDEEVTITTTVTHLGGNNLKNYGLLIGEKIAEDNFNGYGFTIVDTGYYRIFFSYKGKQTVIKDYTICNALKINNATNKLTIVKKRNQFHFLINDQWVYYFTIYDLNVKNIGVINNSVQKVAFSTIKIESFVKINDKNEQDKINDLTTIVQQSQNQFINAYALKNYDQKKITWLPYMNEDNKNETILFQRGYTDGIYEDTWSYDKITADARLKQYVKYIEKVFGQFEKIEKPNVLGKKTFWLSKNPKFAAGTYILLDEYSLSDNYYIKFAVATDRNITKEEIEKMKD